MSPPVNGKIQEFPWRHWRDEFPLARANGFVLMEWTLDQARLYENPLMTPRGRREIRELSERHGVTVVSLSGDCFMQAPFYKAVEMRRAALLDDMKAVLEASADIGLRYVVVPLVDNGSLESEAQQDALRRGLDEVGTVLHGEKTVIAFESDFSPAELGDFIATFPIEEFGINYDIGNSASLGYDPAEEISAYGERILNVHVKDRLRGGTTVPLGEGNANLPLVFRLLQEFGYTGNFILQTARAADAEHVDALCRYRDMVRALMEETTLWT